MLPFRCKGDRDRLGRDLDQFHDRLDILNGAGEQFFRQFDSGTDEFLIRNRPRGEGDESFSGQFFPEVLARERDER